MATEELRVSALIQASPNRIYAAWLDERQHSAFTGGRATVEPWVGGRHTAWEGYIEGMLVELDTGRRLAMTWRTTDFPKDATDSRVEVQLEPVAGGTKVHLVHTGIPEGQADKYKQGWKEFYLDPMKKFFSKPGAMREAIRAASQARRLPIPGVTSARPGSVRPTLRTAKKAEAPAKKAEGTAAKGAGKTAAKKTKTAAKKAPARSGAGATPRRRAPEKKKATKKTAAKKAAAKTATKTATKTSSKTSAKKATKKAAKKAKSTAKKAGSKAKSAAKKAKKTAKKSVKKAAKKTKKATKKAAKKATKKAPSKKKAAKKTTKKAPSRKKAAKKTTKKAPSKKKAGKKSTKKPKKAAKKKRR